MKTKFTLFFLLLFCATVPLTITAQEETSEQGSAEQQEEGSETNQEEGSGTNEDDDSFEGLLMRYKGLDAELIEVKAKFDAAEDPEEIRGHRDQFQRLVDEANAVVEKLRVQGMAKLDEEPDADLFETMMGVLINEASFDKPNTDGVREAQAFELGHKLIDAGIETSYFERAAEAGRLSPRAKDLVRELAARSKEKAADDLPRVKLTTSKGDIVLELFENDAPQTVGNFISLVKDGYYDGLKFHRVIEDFMAQGGCPKGDGSGGPGYNIYCECYIPNYRRHFTGSLSMAKQEPRNTGGSQFFITFRRTDHLDGRHTVFGRVIEGLDIAMALQRIQPGAPGDAQADTITKAEVIRDRGTEYAPRKVN